MGEALAPLLEGAIELVSALLSALPLSMDALPSLGALPQTRELVRDHQAVRQNPARAARMVHMLVSEATEVLDAGGLVHAHCSATWGVLRARLAGLNLLGGGAYNELRRKEVQGLMAATRRRQLHHSMRLFDTFRGHSNEGELELLQLGCAPTVRPPSFPSGPAASISSSLSFPRCESEEFQSPTVPYGASPRGKMLRRTSMMLDMQTVAPNLHRLSSASSSKLEETAPEGKWWRMGPMLGKGAIGVVHLAQDERSGALLAVKSVRFDAADLRVTHRIRSLQAEISLMKRLQHDRIVQYVASARDGDTMHVFMEFAPGGSLRQMLEDFGPFSLQTAASYSRDVLEGLFYLHSHGVVHGDIKGANILLDSRGHAKLTDFGTAVRFSLEEAGCDESESGMGGFPMEAQCRSPRSVQGTLAWMAPEVLQGLSPHSKASDVWSFGVTVMEMLTNEVPFVKEVGMDLMGFLTGNRRPPIPGSVKGSPRELIRACLNRDPSARASVEDLYGMKWLMDGSEERVGPVGLMRTAPELREAFNFLLRTVQLQTKDVQDSCHALVHDFFHHGKLSSLSSMDVRSGCESVGAVGCSSETDASGRGCAEYSAGC